jgi:tetratricopeptide (TPR) repeat protein
MKKVGMVAAHILMLAAWASANANSPESSYIPSASSAWMQQKTIKDPAEYNEYMSALNMTDPTAKAGAMEAFAGKYPASVVRMDALEQAMAAYQQAGNLQRVEQTASHILELDPNNIRALTIATVLARSGASSGNATKTTETCTDSQKGVQALPGWPKPEGISDAEFTTLRNQMAAIFYGGAGFCALQSKNYAIAGANFLKALQLDPNDMQNAFQLSIAELEPNPIDPLGFWYCGRGINTAHTQKNEAAAQSIASYCKAKYRRFHGSEDGWEQILAATATQTAPPAGFAASIKKAPTPAELACQAVAQNDPSELSFSDWEFVLQLRDVAPCNLEAANKVWAAIQDKEKNGEAKLKITVRVISISGNIISVAITDENQQAKKADMEVRPEKPVLKPPAIGMMIDVIGVITKYQLNPFLFIMDKAAYAPAPAAAK